MTLATSILLGCLITPLFPSAPQDEDGAELQLKEADLEKIGSKMWDYLEYKISGDTRRENKAFGTFEKEFDKGSKKTDGKNLLMYPADLEVILHACSSWNKSGISTGKPGTGPTNHDLVKWAYRVPKKYDPRKVTLPLITVVLPGGDTKIAREALTQTWTSEALDEQFMVAAVLMPKDEGKHLEASWRTLAQAMKSFRIDHRKIFIAATGDQAPFVLDLANSFPHRFAGVILIQPSGTVPELINLASVPVWIEGGEEKFAAKLKESKVTVTMGEEGVNGAAVWAQALQRVSYPEKIVFFPPKKSTKQSYWIRIEPEWSLNAETEIDLSPEKRPHVEVSIDREKNKITARVTRVLSIEFLLCDGVLDLDKPIVIDINGQVDEIKKERYLQFFRDYFLRTGDRGVAFTTSYIKSDYPAFEATTEKDK